MKHCDLFFLSFVLLLLCACDGRDTDYDASGVFEATEIIVSARSTGELLAFRAEEGQTVKPGEELGYVDTLQLSLQRQQLQASLGATDSKRLDAGRQLASLRQQIANLERERKRFAELLEADAATEKQVDDIDYQIAVLRRQLAATSEQINSSNTSLGSQGESIAAQLAQVEDRIRQSVITSPGDSLDKVCRGR